ncbi:MAG: host attachment protein, partial [Cystobacter sp.]
MADALGILGANASRARLFSTDERAEKWDLKEEFHHEESRQRSIDLLNPEDNPNAGTLRKPLAENEPNGRQSLEHGRFA